MGQQASKSLAGRLQRASQKIIEKAEQQQASANNAAAANAAAAAAANTNNTDKNVKITSQDIRNSIDPRTGFMRGQGPLEDPRDVIQQQYLEQRNATAARNRKERGESAIDDNDNDNTKGGIPEMPNELVQFLTDIGPLKRQVDESTTPHRLRSRMNRQPPEPHPEPEPQILQSQSPPGGDGRSVRDLPMMDQAPEFTTARTTNFSKETAKTELNRDFRVTDLEFYRMIDGKIAQHDLIKAHYYDNDGNKNEDIDDDEKNSLEMLKHCQNYLELPLIFKDADNMYLGISPNAEEVAISESGDVVAINMLNSKPVPKTKVRLVLEALQDQK